MIDGCACACARLIVGLNEGCKHAGKEMIPLCFCCGHCVTYCGIGTDNFIPSAYGNESGLRRESVLLCVYEDKALLYSPLLLIWLKII